MASKVSTLLHLNHLYIAVLTPGMMSHMLSDWVWHLIDYAIVHLSVYCPTTPPRA